MFQISPRQVHLDFHTSELMPDIGLNFDPEQFARTVKEAAVSSMTVFARGHHGMMYYDSKKFPERVHPNLKRKNLMVDEVHALHSVGVKAPVYITTQWDYYTATRHPEWLIRKPDGAHEGGSFMEPGFYQSLCVNTGYYDFLVEHTLEVMDVLGDELDGLFFDITGIRPCTCAVCRAEMREKGIDDSDERAVREFAAFTMNRFKEKMSAVVRAKKADCTIFYNAGHVGPCTKDSVDSYSHFELESLPSGGWGYLHFPTTARYARKLGLDCLGMTGKFHTSWGDFHSLKNQAALEFEAFRMLSFGFACSIGDQMEPNGRLNPATYRLIGSVYRPFAEREAWGRPSTPVVEAAVITAEDPMTENQMSDHILGAAQMLEELSLQFDIIDTGMALDSYKLIIIPDDVRITPEFGAKLNAYTANGGKVIACGRGGLDTDNRYPACFGAEWKGDTQAYPDFIIAKGALAKDLEEDNEYAIYKQGCRIAPAGGETLIEARAPFFKREGRQFCSHQYTPSAKGEGYPAAIGTANTILFAHPLFFQYRQNAPRWVKILMKNALDILLPERIVTHNGASTVCVSVLDQPEKARTNVHVLTYVPVRKAKDFDIIEERTAAYDLKLTVNIPRAFTRARLVPENVELPVDGNTITIPKVDGYAIVELS